MNVGIGNEALQLNFLEYLFPVFGTVSLQCAKWNSSKMNQVFLKIDSLETFFEIFSVPDNSRLWTRQQIPGASRWRELRCK